MPDLTQARRLARNDALEVADVLTWFEEGTPEAGITALGLNRPAAPATPTL